MDNRADIEARFFRSRNSLRLVVLLTMINVVLDTADAPLSFPFSASLPSFFVFMGQAQYESTGGFALFAMGLTAAFLVVSVYYLCFIFSKKHPSLIVAALVFFALDTLFLLGLAALGGFDYSVLIDLGFHGWVIYSLALGVKAWAEMRKTEDGK